MFLRAMTPRRLLFSSSSSFVIGRRSFASEEFVDLLLNDGITVSLPKEYAHIDVATLPPNPYGQVQPKRRLSLENSSAHLEKQNPITLPKNTEVNGRFINVCHMQEAFRWDSDSRSALFEPTSLSFVPIGSLLKVYYYPLPLMEGIQLPLRRQLSGDEIQEQKWRQVTGKVYDVSDNKIVEIMTAKYKTDSLAKRTETNVIPEGMQIYIPPAFRADTLLGKAGAAGSLGKSFITTNSKSAGALSSNDNPPGKGIPYYTINESQQPQVFFGQYIASEGYGSGRSMTLRNTVDGIGVDMIFQVFSPLLVGIEVKRRAERDGSIKDMRYLRFANNTEASRHEEPGKLEPLKVKLIVSTNKLEANVPYVYLAPPMREPDNKKKK